MRKFPASQSPPKVRVILMGAISVEPQEKHTHPPLPWITSLSCGPPSDLQTDDTRRLPLVTRLNHKLNLSPNRCLEPTCQLCLLHCWTMHVTPSPVAPYLGTCVVCWSATWWPPTTRYERPCCAWRLLPSGERSGTFLGCFSGNIR